MLKNFIDNFEEYACSICLGVMILCLSLQVVARMTLGTSIAWTEELSRFSFIWAVYIGGVLAVKRGTHVRITAQFSLLGDKGKMFFRMLSDLIWIGFNIFFFVNSMEMIVESLEYPETSPTLKITKSWVELIIPLCFLLMSLRTVQLYVRHWRAGTMLKLAKYEEGVQ